MFRKTPKDGEDSPSEVADVGESAQARYQQGLQDAKRLVQSPSQIRDPEDMVRALVNLRQSYEHLCALDPVFRAEENQTEVSQFAEAQDKLIKRLLLIAKIKPNLYRIARAQSQYKEVYPPMPSSPTDVHMHEPSPGFKWTNLLKDWQPFRRSASTATPTPSADTSPMEVDQTLRLADGRVTSPMDLSMWQLTRLSNAKVRAEKETRIHSRPPKLIFKRRATLTKPGRSLTGTSGNTSTQTTKAARPTFRTRAAVRPSYRSRLPGTPCRSLHTTPRAAASTRRRSFSRARRRVGAGAEDNGGPPSRPRSLDKDRESLTSGPRGSTGGDDARTTPGHDSAGAAAEANDQNRFAAAEVSDPIAVIAETSDADASGPSAAASNTCSVPRGCKNDVINNSSISAKVHAPPAPFVNNKNAESNTVSTQTQAPFLSSEELSPSGLNSPDPETKPLFQLHVTSRDPSIPVTIKDALDFVQIRASQSLDLNSKVRQLSVRFSAVPWPPTPRLNLLGRLQEAGMEELQARLDDMQRRMSAQEATLAEEQRSAAAAREQLADRERLIEQLRQGSQPVQSENPETNGGAQGQEAPAPSNAGNATRSSSTASNATNGRIDNLEDLMAAFRSEMSAAVGAVKNDILTEVRAQNGARPAGRAPFEDRLRDAERESRHWRGLLCGLEPEESSSRSQPTATAPSSAGPAASTIPSLKEIEADMRNILALEETHRAAFPRPGEGVHYLAGSPPFWRRPWPANWRVHRPWEFTRVYDHQELTQRLKYPVLSEFNGDRDAYPQWQRLFYQTVHVQDIDDETKYGYLLRYVSSAVKQIIIDGLGRSRSDYCFAVTRLERQYGASSWHEDEAAEMVTTFRPFPAYDLKRANEFMRKLEGYLSSDAVGTPEVAERTVMPAIRRILPHEWVEGYYKYSRQNKIAMTPHTALDYLRTEIELKTELAPRRQNNLEPRRRNPAPRPPGKAVSSPRPSTAPAPIPPRSSTPKAVTFMAREATPPRERCYCCGGGHRLKQCPHFHALTNRERRRVVEDHELCLTCFSDDHVTDDCLVNRLCSICRDRHSQWVHTPEDDEAAAALLLARDDPEDEAYEWCHEPGLSGEFLGEGFMAVDAAETDEYEEPDSLYFAGLATRHLHLTYVSPPTRDTYDAVPTAGRLDGDFLGAGFSSDAPDDDPEVQLFAGAAIQETPDGDAGPRRSQRLAVQPVVSYDAMHRGRAQPWSEPARTAAPGQPRTQTTYPSRIIRARRSPINAGAANPPAGAAGRGRGRASPGRRAKPAGVPATPPRLRTTPPVRPRALAFDAPLAVPSVRPHSVTGIRPMEPATAVQAAEPTPGTDRRTTNLTRPAPSRDSVARTPADDIKVGLQQAVLNVQNPKSKAHMTVNALVDSGSNHTAISGRLAEKLALEGLTAPYRVVTFGGVAYHQPSQLVQITLRTVDGNRSRTVIVRSVDNLCGNLKVQRWNELKHQWDHTRDLQFPEPVGDLKVDLLVGTENSDFVRVTGPDLVGQRPQDPVVRRTVLGLMPMGLTKVWSEAVEERVNLAQAFACLVDGESPEEDAARKRRQATESSLYWDLRRLFAVEHRIEEDFLRNVKDSKAVSSEQARAAGQVLASRVYLEPEKRYRVGIPWRDSRRPPSNLWDAVRLFKGYLRRQGEHSEAVNQMMTTINEWLRAGYARILSPEEARRPRGFVIPSFVVTRIDKTTTQHRLVINAAKEFGGLCLNDYIARTPDAMNGLYDVLLRFRTRPYTYTGDIQHMFLQIETDPADRPYIRVLYQPTRPGPIHVVECSRHMFGLSSSPYVAMETIKRHTWEHRERWPLAHWAVQEASIVDDVLASMSSEEELYRLHEELREAFAAMSMKIHKCASNYPPLMHAIPPSQRAKQVRLEDISSDNPEMMPVIKALGMVYEPDTDEFRFEYSHDPPSRWTLRHMVSAVARLYDPLGLVTPFLMAGRAIVQLIWLEGKKWDEPIDANTARKCSLWMDRARELVELRIPRCVLWQRPGEGVRLVVFCDACRLGYAAAAYAVGQRDTHLLAARGRVAPAKKDESVQRLELAGCQLAVSVAAEVCSALGLRIEDATFYTDSTTALAWLRTTSKMSVYVSNRVCKVRDRTELHQWRYVPGTENPADVASRGCRPKKLVQDRMWLEGPAFLRSGQEPDQPVLIEDAAVKEELISFENHLRKITLFRYAMRAREVTEFMLDFVEKRDLMGRAVRVLSLLVEAGVRLRREDRINAAGETIYEELWQAIVVALVRRHQEEYWTQELHDLTTGRRPARHKTLRPFVDGEGILRVDSRLNGCWWLPAAVRNPMLLKPKGAFVQQLFRHHHVEALRHAGGPARLLAQLRRKFWITNARGLARATVENCQTCQKLRARPHRPAMANLHPARLGDGQALRAFRQVGVDMAGPFITRGPPVTRGRRVQSKRYLLIITCSVTRAVCLEMMMTAEADSCVMALERFVAVYGRPDTVNSDSGANLVAAKRVIDDQSNWVRRLAAATRAKFPDLKWTLNPPYSPNWGGHYERLIGVAKQTLYKVMANRAGVLGDEELATFFKRTQDLMNNRPITAVVQGAGEPLALTPNCFLKTGRQGPLLPPDCGNTPLLRRRQLMDGVVRQYWKQFVGDYLPTLHKTEKWHAREEPLKVGDIVSILYPGLPTGRWPLARVTGVFPGRDGQVRSVQVESQVDGKKHELKRSVSGLIPVLRT